MSNVNQVQAAAYATPVVQTQNAATTPNQSSGFGYALGQAAAGGQALTPSVAQDLMYRSMTTGVPNTEMDQYGGYSAVKAMFDANGGSYSLDAIPASQRQQLAQQVATSGVGNMSLLVSEHMSLLPSALYEMAQNGVDQASINQIYQRVQDAQGSAGAVLNASGTAAQITPDVANSLMHRSMTTGVPKSEMDLYGGYDAVKAMYDSGNGSYSAEAIPVQEKQQLAMQVAATGVGNIAVATKEHIDISPAVYQSMADNGIDVATIENMKLSAANAPFVDSNSYIDSFMGALSSTN